MSEFVCNTWLSTLNSSVLEIHFWNEMLLLCKMQCSDSLEIFFWFLQIRLNVLQFFFACRTRVFCTLRGHYCLAIWLQLCNNHNIIIMIIVIIIVIQKPDRKSQGLSDTLLTCCRCGFTSRRSQKSSHAIHSDLRNSVRLFVLRMFSKWGSAYDVRWPPLCTSTRCYNILPTSLALG